MFKWLLPTVVAVIAGVLVLVGALAPNSPVAGVRSLLLEWAMILGVFALILGYLNLIGVHLGRLKGKNKHKIASLLIILAALGTAALVIIEGPEGNWTQQLVKAILIPGESALLALTAFTLLVVGIRALRVRRSAGTLVFLAATLIALAAAVPYAGMKLLDEIAAPVTTVAASGTRGLLLGVALGTVLTGIRLLTGIDRPHSEE